MVILGSVDGTIFWYSTPASINECGIRSTGIRSIRFIMKTHTKIVRANGATSGFRPWNVSLTVPSTNSTTISTKLIHPLGVSEDALTATRRNSQQKMRPSPTDQSMESTWIALKPIPPFRWRREPESTALPQRQWCHHPAQTLRKLAIGQVRQVMDDIF